MNRLTAHQAAEALEKGQTKHVWLVLPLKVSSNSGLYSCLSQPEHVLNHVDGLIARQFLAKEDLEEHFWLSDYDSYAWERNAQLEMAAKSPISLIDEERYFDLLGAVPPFKMFTHEGMDCFICGEFYTGRTAYMCAEKRGEGGSKFYMKLVHVDDMSTWISMSNADALLVS